MAAAAPQKPAQAGKGGRKMAQEKVPGKDPDPREVYAKIIDLPPWEPNSRHPRMGLRERAAQFAPFAALSGYDEMIREETRLTDARAELSDSETEQLDRALNRIGSLLATGARPEAEICYFIPDEQKSGGRYRTVTARIRRIDPVARKLILAGGTGPDIPESIRLDMVRSLAPAGGGDGYTSEL